jgi:hypothetical protein
MVTIAKIIIRYRPATLPRYLQVRHTAIRHEQEGKTVLEDCGLETIDAHEHEEDGDDEPYYEYNYRYEHEILGIDVIRESLWPIGIAPALVTGFASFLVLFPFGASILFFVLLVLPGGEKDPNQWDADQYERQYKESWSQISHSHGSPARNAM